MKNIKQNKKHERLRLHLILFILSNLFLLPCSVYSQPKKDTLFINQPGEYPIYKHLYIYETDKKVTPQYVYDSVKPGGFITLFPNKAFNNSTSITPYYWLMVTVKNNLPHDETFYYWLNSLGLSIVKTYQKTNNGNFELIGNAGFYTPIKLRQSQSHDAEFHFIIRKHDNCTLLLTFENPTGEDAFFLPQLSDINTRMQKREDYYLLIGILSGVMLIAFLLNIFYAISLKEKIHYVYALYVLCMLYELLTLEGIAESYLVSNDYRLAETLIHVFPAICMTLMTRIMQWFLNQKKSNSYFKTVLDVVTYVLLAITVLFIAEYFIVLPASFSNMLQMAQAACIGIQIILIFCSAIEKTIQKYQLAWVYLAAVFWLAIGLMEYIMMFLGVNDIEVIRSRHPNDLELGLAFEAIVVFIAIIYRYNLYKKEKEILLIEVNEQQQNLLKRIVAAEEEERQRIATDLHDDVGTTLSTLNLHISNMPQNMQNKTEIETYLNRSFVLSNKAADDIRDIAHNLLPKDFKAAKLFTLLQKRIDELNALRRVRLHLVVEGNEKRLNEMFSIIVYRIISELLTNILKHSLASEATIQLLIEDNNVQIMAEDDGVGFNIETIQEGIGLKNIKRRIEFLKGTILIDGSSYGTQTIIQLPLS